MRDRYSPGPGSGRIPDERIYRIFGPGTGGHYDDIVERTLGPMDRVWKERVVEKLENPGRIADLACGTGILTFLLRQRFPDCEVVGVDMNAEYLEVARRRALDRGDTSVRFIEGRAEDAAIPGDFDAIVTCYLPKYADLDLLIPRLERRLRPGGVIVFHDFYWPSDRFVEQYLESRFEDLVEWARRELPEAVGMFEDLPGVIRESRWLDQSRETFERLGLTDVDCEFLDLEQAAIVWGRKPA